MIKQHSQVQKTMLGSDKVASDKVASDDKKVWNNLKLKGDAKNVMTK